MIFKLWADEKQYYIYPQGPNDKTGHYTQIVNKNVTEIGCACSNCNGDKICACQYNPGQYGGEPPY